MRKPDCGQWLADPMGDPVEPDIPDQALTKKNIEGKIGESLRNLQN